MNKMLIGALLFGVLNLCQAANRTAVELVTDGLDVYKQKGASEAIKSWVKNSGLEGSNVVSTTTEVFARLESFYGQFESYEISKVYRLSERSEMIFFVINYQKGLTFAYLQAYKTKAGLWVATEFQTNTNATKIWPTQMFDER